MVNNLRVDCCIVGMGPAGIGAALTLLEKQDELTLACIDVGDVVEKRFCSVLQKRICTKEISCNIITGFGGCSLLSGGKISLFPAGSKLGNILGSVDEAKKCLNEAKEKWGGLLGRDLPYIYRNTVKKQKHFEKIGFNYKHYEAYTFSEMEIRNVYKAIQEKIEQSKNWLAGCELLNIKHTEEQYVLYCRHQEGDLVIEAKRVVFAPGRWGRQTLKMLNKTLGLGAKPSKMDVGVRLEIPTEIVSELIEDHEDLKLTFDDARTYCVCKGGKVASYYLEGIGFTEGFFDATHQTNQTNFAILTRVDSSQCNDEVFEEIKRRSLAYSKGMPVVQSLKGYLESKQGSCEFMTSSGKSLSVAVEGEIKHIFPETIGERIKNSVIYFLEKTIDKQYWDQVKVYGPEVDYNGLVFPVNPDFSVQKDIYIIGSGTGHFRGILQAFCSGIICGESLLKTVKNND